MDQTISPELLEQIKESYKFFDKDDDGTISLEDLYEQLKLLGHNLSEEQMQELIQSSGATELKLDFEQFKKLIFFKFTDVEGVETLIEAFSVFDKDQTGKISQQELRSILTTLGTPLISEEMDGLILEADVDADGNINYKDLIAHLTSK